MTNIADDIIQRAASGDVGAFEEIYKAYSGFVYTVSYRITGNREEALEATQDVFMNAYRQLKNFRKDSSIKTWLYRITVNTSINHYNKSARMNRRREYIEDVPESVYARNNTERAIEKDDSEEYVNRLLQGLTPEHRACIVLREIQGFDYKEMSDTLHININTVKTRLKRAREKLLSLGREAKP